MRRLVAGTAAGLLLALAAPSGAGAATISVGTTADEYGAGAACSLREAVEAANDNMPFGGCGAGEDGAEDVISLSGGATYPLGRTGAGEDANVTGDLDLDTDSGSVEIIGPSSARPTIDAGFLDRAMDVSGDGALELSGLRVVNGLVTGSEDRGGGLRWLEPASPGDLTVSDSVFDGNTALAGGGAIEADTAGTHSISTSSLTGNATGAAGTIHSHGELLVSDSQVAHNTGGGIGAEGTLELRGSTITGHVNGDTQIGGILAEGDALIVNSTVSGNLAAFVGGIEPHAALTVRFSTIAGNVAPEAGGQVAGGIDSQSATSVTLEGVLLAGNRVDASPSNCNQTSNVAEGANPNLESADTCGLDPSPGQGSLINADPQLAPLAGNGGPTLTHGLYPESPALDAALPGCGLTPGLELDQRGVARPAGAAACDIGAFEGSVPRPPPPTPMAPSTTAKKKRKKCKKGGAKRRSKCRKKKGAK